MNKQNLVFLAVVICVNCVFSNSTLAVSLKQALTSAYSNDERHKIERSKFLEAIETFPQALAGFMPKASLTGTYEKTKQSAQQNIGGSFGNSVKNTSRTRSVKITQPVFSGWSSVSQMKAAQSTFRKARSDFYNEEQETILKEIEAYIDCIADKEKLEISKISAKNSKIQLDSVQERLNLGESTRTELALTQRSFAVANANAAGAEAKYEASKAGFFSVFGTEPNNLKMPELKEGNIPKNLEELTEKALKLNLTLESARHGMKIAKANENSLKGGLLPKVELSFEGSDRLNSNASPANNINKRSRSATTALSVTIPILSKGGAEYSEIRVARQKKRRAFIAFDATIKAIKTGCKSSYSQYLAAKSAFDAMNKAVEAAHIAYEGSIQEELLGSKSIVDIIEYEEKLSKAKSDRVDAHKKLILAFYKVKFLTGDLTAKSMKLPVKYFEPEREFKRIKTKIVGF